MVLAKRSCWRWRRAAAGVERVGAIGSWRRRSVRVGDGDGRLALLNGTEPMVHGAGEAFVMAVAKGGPW